MSMVAATKGVTVLLFVLFPSSVSSAGCDASVADAMMPCITNMAHGGGGGSVCDMWNSAVCCLKKPFANCPELSAKVDKQINMMSSTFSGMPGMGDVSGCSQPSCSGGSGSPAPGPTPPPVPTEKIIETLISFANDFDPTTFNLTSYMEKAGEEVGAAAEAAIKAFDIVLTYAVPPETTDDKLKDAIVEAMGILKEKITILTGGRRLTTGPVDKQVSIKADTPTEAKDFKEKSASKATTDSLTTKLGAAVSVKTPPVTKMKLQTKVTSTKTKSELEQALKSGDMVTEVGGSISSVESSLEESSSSGAFRSGMVVTSIALAVLAGSV